MDELAGWIDKDIKSISNTKLFLKYFSEIQIEEIEGTFFFNNEEKGIDIILADNEIVRAIHLNSGTYLGVGSFPGDLPYSLKFTYGINDVRKLMGVPDNTSGDYKVPAFGGKRSWDKYFFNNYTLHIQYSNQEDYIELVTVESKAFEEESTPE
ncbi:MAG: hypothetical protein ACXVI9_01950 [Mucilaginibacter sp.]